MVVADEDGDGGFRGGGVNRLKRSEQNKKCWFLGFGGYESER